MGVCAGSGDQDGPAYAHGQHHPPKTNLQEQHPKLCPEDPSMCWICGLGQAARHKHLKLEGKTLTSQRSRTYSYANYLAVVKQTSESTLKSGLQMHPCTRLS